VTEARAKAIGTAPGVRGNYCIELLFGKRQDLRAISGKRVAGCPVRAKEKFNVNGTVRIELGSDLIRVEGH